MTDDEWQAHVTHEAAKAIGEWLQARGGLHQPVRSLTMRDLEAMAQNAISTFIVKTSHRVATGQTSPRRRSSRRYSWAESLRALQPSGARLVLHPSDATGSLSDICVLLDALPARGWRDR